MRSFKAVAPAYRRRCSRLPIAAGLLVLIVVALAAGPPPAVNDLVLASVPVQDEQP